MRYSKNLTGKRLISVDNGTDLGIVKDVYFDGGISSVIGLYLGSEGLFKRKANVVPRVAITLFGQDAILVTQADVVTDSLQNEEIKEWVRRDQLQGRSITTAGGTKVGTVGDVLIDDEGMVVAFMLAMIYIDSPVTQARMVRRDAVLDIGSINSPMTIDLAKAEQQSLSEHDKE